MSSIDFDDPPYVHDYHLARVEHSGSMLRLLLRRRAYSKEHLDFVRVWEGWLTFLNVSDIDAGPSERDVNSALPKSFIDRLFHRIFRRIFRTYDVRKLGTVRDLMAMLDQEGLEMGEPLTVLELLGSGYVLRTTLAGSYFIRASSASLVELSE